LSTCSSRLKILPRVRCGSGLSASTLSDAYRFPLAGPSRPWAILLPNPSGVGYLEGLRNPSPLYQRRIDGILVFLILWPFARKARPRLAVGAMFTLLYGCARFFTEYFRVPDWETTVAGMPITSGQVLSLPMIVAALALLASA